MRCVRNAPVRAQLSPAVGHGGGELDGGDDGDAAAGRKLRVALVGARIGGGGAAGPQRRRRLR